MPVCVEGAGHAARRVRVLTEPSQTMTDRRRAARRGCSPTPAPTATTAPPIRRRCCGRSPATSKRISRAPERLSLVDDEWALVRAGRHSVADYLTLAAGFGREHTSGVLDEVRRPARVHRRLSDHRRRSRPRFEAFVRTLLAAAVRRGRVRRRPPIRQRRSPRAARGGDRRARHDRRRSRRVIAKARTALDRALAGGAPLDPTAGRRDRPHGGARTATRRCSTRCRRGRERSRRAGRALSLSLRARPTSAIRR